MDGPATICQDGANWWYKDGLLHRLDGPAMIHCDGKFAWCYEDYLVTLFDKYNEIVEFNENNFKKCSKEFENNLLKYI